MKEIRYSKQATKKLLKVPSNDSKRIVNAIAKFAKGEVGALDIKKMTNSQYEQIRIGDWRVILLDNTVIYVVKIGSRGDVYKR